MEISKRIGLVAHDNRKKEFREWVSRNYHELAKHELICTQSTGHLVEDCLRSLLPEEKHSSLRIIKLLSGPLGGDQQLGARVSEGKIDMLFFLWDPMQPQPHDFDVKALMRITALYNVPTANNSSTADFLISSPLMRSDYKPFVFDYSENLEKEVDG